MGNREDLIKKIIALREKIPEKGASENEAMVALEMADKMMAKHQISEEELNKIKISEDMRNGSFTRRQKAIHPSLKYCGVAIGKFCGVRVWSDLNNDAQFFGLNQDVEMAEFLMKLIHDSMERAWKEFLRDNPKQPGVSRHTQYWSFMYGFGERVREKMQQIIESRQMQSKTGTDLIACKEALVEQGMRAMFPHLAFKRKQTRGINADISAYAQGSIAGNKVNLSRPITTGQAGPRQIT